MFVNRWSHGLPGLLSRAGGVALAGGLLAGSGIALQLQAQEARWLQRPDATNAVPLAPEDPTDAKVYAVLDRLCASCHQRGKLAVPYPGRDFAHVLDVKRLASDAALVSPGNPDGSRLYTLMQIRGQAHEDLDVNSADLDALRDWISGLTPTAACADRTPLTAQDDERAIERGGADAPLTTRFLSLRHLYNACATPADLKAYRHAVTVVINSLSWSLKPIQLDTIDEQETLIRIDLPVLGWDTARWQRLSDIYPYVSTTGSPSPAASPGTLRADWFVATAMKPPLYYELLGFPDRLQTLQASLKIDSATDLIQNRLRRIGIKSSTVARGSRLLQRQSFANGAFWTTYEYAPTPGRPDLFDAPAGPGSRGAAKPDGSLAIFSLPSGYNAFFMANGDGLRVNDVPSSVLRHDGFPAQRISAGGTCLACHSRGVVAASDELRARVQGDTSIPRDIRERVLAVHAGADEMSRAFDDDNSRLAGAMTQSGLVPGAAINGLDPVIALTRAYERDVGLDTLAAELAIPVDQLVRLGGKMDGLAGDLIDQVLHGAVSRRSVERAHGAVLSAFAGAPAADPKALLPAESDRPDGLQLIVKTGAASYKAGEALAVRIRASEPCYLTLINVDRSGRGGVVFPNDFDQNNLLEAGKEVKIPADGAPYVFRLRDPGRETVIGHCMTASKAPPGIRHDFERQRFTELGDYRAFLNRTAANESEGKATGKIAEPKQRRRGRGSATASTAPQKGEAQARTAVRINVVP